MRDRFLERRTKLWMVCLFAYGKSSRSASADNFDFFLVYDNRKND